MSMHNGTDGPAARAVCRCGLSNGERRNGSSPASHTVPPAHTAPPLPASADVTAAATASATATPAVAAEPAAPRMTL
ncbi:MAG TPA: hypothetical protein VLH10_06770, partial [Yinghuangia sp.]|nr:hypothetical protein [Yinghuangia sp.]